MSDITENTDNPEASSPKEKTRPIRKWIIRGVLVAVILSGLAFGIPYFLYAMSHESTDDAFLDGRIVSISPRVSGHVAVVHVADNQSVKAGDLLVEIDPADFRARLDAAEAAEKSAQAALAAAIAGAGAAESQYQEAEARLSIAKAALAQAEAAVSSAEAVHGRDQVDLKRVRQMAETNNISRQQLDHAVATEQVSAASLKEAKKNVRTHEAMVRQAEAAVQIAAAGQREAEARVDASRADAARAAAVATQATLNLSYTRIKSPRDGFVTKKAVEEGAFVQAGQALLAIVTKDIWVTANFKETQLTRMQVGQPVAIVVDAYPDITFHGRINSFQHGTGSRFSLLPPENATGNYVKVVQRVPVKIVFDRPDEIQKVLLAPGMSVVPEVDVGSGDGKSS